MATSEKASQVPNKSPLMARAEDLGFRDEALVLRTPEGRIIDWNAGAEVLYGYKRDQAVGRMTSDLFSTELPEPLDDINDALASAGYWKGVLAHTLADGSEIVVESRWVLDALSDRPRETILEINVDVTEKVQADHLLLKDEGIFLQILDSLPDGVYVVMADGKSHFVNRKAWEILGRGNADMAKTSELAEAFVAYVAGTEKLYPRESLPITRALKGEYVTVEDMEIRRLDRTIALRVSGAPVYDARGELLFACVSLSDVTGLKEIEKSLVKANRQLRESNGELENYSYAVSHDLKTPLRTIRSFSNFLLEDYSKSLNPTAQDYLTRIAKAATRMDQFIDQLLNLSRVGRQFTEVEEVDMGRLMSEIISDAKEQAQAGEIIVRDQLPTVPTQRVWMKQLLMNLISNGLKYNRSEAPRVEVACSSKGDEYLFSVRDNGIGIDPKYQDRLFGLFQRFHTTQEFEGTGIGLATCKKVVENFGGRIWAESAPGAGTTFFFSVPRSVPVGAPQGGSR